MRKAARFQGILSIAMTASLTVPSVAMADSVPYDLPGYSARPAMPHVDESRLIDDGSLMHDLIVSANETGRPVMTEDYTYAHSEDADRSCEIWLPVWENESHDATKRYEPTARLSLELSDSFFDVPEENLGDALAGSPSRRAWLLGEDDAVIHELRPVGQEDISREDIAYRTISDSRNRMFEWFTAVPSQRYTLHIEERLPDGTEDRHDIRFFAAAGETVCGIDEDGNDLRLESDWDDWVLLRTDYPSGEHFRASLRVNDVMADPRFDSDVLYDPGVSDIGFDDILANRFPDGYDAEDLAEAWADTLKSREYTRRRMKSLGGTRELREGDVTPIVIGVLVVAGIALAVLTDIVLVPRRKRGGKATSHGGSDDAGASDAPDARTS